MNNRKLWAIAIAFILLGSGLALALPAIQSHGAKPAGKHGAQRNSPFAQLNLTPDQKQKLDQIKTDFQTQTETLRADMEAKRAELEPLLRAKVLDENQIMAKAGDVAKIQAQLSDYRLQQRLAMFKILTFDQRNKLLDNLHSRGGKGKCNHADRPAQTGN